MSTQIQRRRGTTAQHASFTGAIGETTIDTDKEVVVVHDGTQVGGYPLMRENASNSALALGSAATPSLKFTGDTNTGIYSPGADQVAVSTGGTVRLTTTTTGITSALPVDVPLGAVGTPSITFTGDLNTGIYSPAADTLAFVEGGVEAMRIDSSGRLGIGTSSPGERLSVAGNIDLPNVNTFIKGGGHNVVQVDATRTYFYGGTSGVQLRTADNASSLIEITNAGLVGIGTTSPGATLDVSGTVNFKPAAGYNALFQQSATALRINYLNDAGSANVSALYRATDFAWQKGDGGEVARIDSSGRLLVGTSTSGGRVGATVQIAASASSASGYLLEQRYAADNASGADLFLTKSRGSVASPSVVANGDNISIVRFSGYDGTNYLSAAEIAAAVDGTPGTNDMPGRLVFSTTADGASSPTERMRIDQGGNITVNDTGGTQYSAKLYVNGSISARNGGVDGTYSDAFISGYTSNYSEKNIIRTAVSGVAAQSGFMFMVSNGGGSASVTESFRINRASCAVAGALSKGSGSFRISHPLPEKADTHHLVHSFIEGPQADLIYRGHITLINGAAQVNIDEASRMTEGTFEALCTNVCCFTSNETDWTPVRGYVDCNILSIEAQDPTSTAEVCWMVIGERKDQHMLDTDWTDENGRVITEPTKEVTPSVTS